MLQRIVRWFGAVLVFGLAFVVNPAYVAGCGSSEGKVEPKMVEADLLRQLDELNGIHTWGFEQDGEQYELDLSLVRATEAESTAQASRELRIMSVAHACGTTTFYQSASACITTHALAVKGTLSLRRLGTDAATIVSDVPVLGTVTDVPDTELRFGDSHLTLEGERADGEDYALGELQAVNLGTEKLSFAFSAYE